MSETTGYWWPKSMENWISAEHKLAESENKRLRAELRDARGALEHIREDVRSCVMPYEASLTRAIDRITAALEGKSDA